MRRLLALLFAAVVFLGACAQDEDPALQAPDETAEAAEEASPPADDGDDTVNVTDNEEHGEILVSAEGRTLYVFLNDTDGKSMCTGQCLENWPPLEAADGEPTAGDGVDGELTTIERDDGTSQVAIGERPLYTYAADQAPGDTKGQGVGDKWFVVGPDGEPIQEGAG